MFRITTSHKELLVEIIQPSLFGLMDGSVSTLGPIFAAANMLHHPINVFILGLTGAIGDGISMGMGEALSDDGKETGRGSAFIRGMSVGISTFFGGIFHTLPFLLPNMDIAKTIAYILVVLELILITTIKTRYMKSDPRKTIVQILIGGGLVFSIGVILGRYGGGL